MYLAGFTCNARYERFILSIFVWPPAEERCCTHLHVALGDVERGDSGVGDTTGKDTTEHALGVVNVVVGDGTGVAGVPGDVGDLLDLLSHLLGEVEVVRIARDADRDIVGTMMTISSTSPHVDEGRASRERQVGHGIR